MKFIPDIYATFFNKAIGFRVGFGIDKLKDLSFFNEFFSHQANVIFFHFQYGSKQFLTSLDTKHFYKYEKKQKNKYVCKILY